MYLLKGDNVTTQTLTALYEKLTGKKPTEEELNGCEEFQAAFAGERDQPLGGAAPEQGGRDDVGVKNYAHGPREVRRARPSVRIRVPLR